MVYIFWRCWVVGLFWVVVGGSWYFWVVVGVGGYFSAGRRWWLVYFNWWWVMVGIF